MNKDDRSALIELGGQFTPALFQGLDAEETSDEVLIDRIGQAFSELRSTRGVLLSSDESYDPSQPSRDELAAWLDDADSPMTVNEVEMIISQDDNKRSYKPVERPATVKDCLSWRLDSESGELHLVMSDGKTHHVQYNPLGG